MPAPVHIGLNLIFLVPGETGGMEVAARELIPELVAQAPDMRFTAFINREAARTGDGPWGELIPSIEVPVHARNRVAWVVGEQQMLPRLAAHAGVDVLHSLASTGPAWGRFRRVVTVHDLIYARYPEAHPGLRALGMRLLVPLAARRSHRVIAVSYATRDDLVGLMRIHPAKIDVVHQGVGAVRRGTSVPEAQLRERYDLGERQVLLSLSAKRPHKNLGALIGALAHVEPGLRPVLVLAGYHTPHEAELRARVRALGLTDDVRFLGWVGPEEVEGLWALTAAFVFPSLYEGFGLPVLEAMARGVPVACAAASVLPEVVGDAALQFDPHDEGAIAGAIVRLLTEPDLAERLRAAGLARAREFNWARTAELTLETYRRALGSSTRA